MMLRSVLLLVVGIALLCGNSVSVTTSIGVKSWEAFFARLDSNSDLVLDQHEIRSYACKFDLGSCLTANPTHELQLSQAISWMDKDNSQTIELDEFLEKYNTLKAASRRSTSQKVGEPIVPGVQQVHLALTTDPTEMVVKWVTKDRDSTVVKYGLSSGSYSWEQNGTMTTYNAGVFGWSGWIHTVVLTNLKPSTKYYYMPGSPKSGYWGDEYYFTTAPANDSQGGQYVFAVAADMGTAIPMGWAVTLRMIYDSKSYPFGMVIHPGDVSYAGTGHEWEFEEIWDLWCDQVEGLAAYVPYMFAVGNHERFYNFTSFNTRFQMPGEQSGGNGNFWWSMDYGNVHFAFMSTEHPYDPNTPQYLWLQADLEKANQNRKQRPWVIVSGHRPMYNSDTSEYSAHRPGAHFQVVIEPLLHKYSVDLFLCGHMHMFERVHPVLDGNVVATGNVYHNPTATAHVVQATAGVFTDYSFINPQPAWSAYRDNNWGYGRMTTNMTNLHYQFIHYDTGKTLDEFWIIKN